MHQTAKIGNAAAHDIIINRKAINDVKKYLKEQDKNYEEDLREMYQ
jgi:hypothetical protein